MQLSVKKKWLGTKWKAVIVMAGIGIELLAASGLLFILLHPDISQNQVVKRATPYTFLIMAGIGVLNMRQWGRYLAISASFIGFILQLMELSVGFDLKDLAQAVLFLLFLILFTREEVEEYFT